MVCGSLDILPLLLILNEQDLTAEYIQVLGIILIKYILVY